MLDQVQKILLTEKNTVLLLSRLLIISQIVYHFHVIWMSFALDHIQNLWISNECRNTRNAISMLFQVQKHFLTEKI